MASPDPSRLSGDLYRQWEKAMSGWWDQVLESPAFLGAVGQNLTATAQTRSAYEKAVDETMERMHLPTRQDMVRLAKVCTMLEDRLLAQEDILLELKDKLGASERSAIQARIEAAETRLEMRERLDALQHKLDAAPAAATATATAPTTPPVASSTPDTTPAPRRGKAGGA